MKRLSLSSIVTAAMLSLLATAPALHAASGTWNGATDANWATSTNWSAVPGATTGTTNADIATFNTDPGTGFGGASNPIVIDANRNVKSLLFDTSAGSYVIGAAAGNALVLTGGGSITLAATATGTNLTETINAPLVLSGSYAITNNAPTASNDGFRIGGNISGGSATTLMTLTLNGSGLGNNVVSGNISNGLDTGGLALSLSGGSWTLTGNNTYTGGTTFSGSSVVAINS
ncbi:MAG TPA: hypothetical protein VIM58_13170, partial [Candidatus Methylacidiphilales bacterium]